jgi:pimeloyl-ACP methyl ester carboxylesterase
MTLGTTVRTIAGIDVHLVENPGRPLLVTLRMAPLGMNLWDKVWPHLADEYELATFNVPVPDEAAFADPISMFDKLADRCIDVVDGLGHERFHYLGATSGTRLGLHVLTGHADRLLSCTLYDPVYVAGDRGPISRMEEMWYLQLKHGGLEAYTWWWLLHSFTPAYAQDHFAELAAMVQRRLDADKERGLDADKVLRWNRVLTQQTVGDGALGRVSAPTLIVGVPASAHWARALAAKIPTARFSFVPIGAFGMFEDPTTFLAPIRPFLDRTTSRPLAQSSSPGNIAVMVDGTVTHVVEPRPAAAVVFLHGWLMTPEMWDQQLAALRDTGVRAVALAQPGHAGTSGPSADFSMEMWADQTVTVLDQLGIDRFVLVGHSMGGMLALTIAERTPERVLGVAMVSSTDEPWETADRDAFVELAGAVSLAWSPQLAAQVGPILLGEDFLNATQGWLESWTKQVANDDDLPTMLHLAKAVAYRPDLTSVTSKLSVPLLVIHGDNDDAVEIERGRRLAGRANDSRLVEIPNIAHCPPLEAHRAVTDALLPFVTRLLV